MARSRRDVWAAWGVVVGLLTAIFWASHRQIQVAAPFAHADKLLHAIAYAVVAACFYWALRVSWPLQGHRWHAWLAGALAAAYGATDEWHQTFVPGRDGNVDDWVADVIGAFAVALLAATIKRGRVEPVR